MRVAIAVRASARRTVGSRAGGWSSRWTRASASEPPGDSAERGGLPSAGQSSFDPLPAALLPVARLTNAAAAVACPGSAAQRPGRRQESQPG